MFLTLDQIVRMREEDLVRFIDHAPAEATGFIDYKGQIDTQKPEKANAELLKDVSGFANAEGGHLLIGVAEPDREEAGASFIRGIEDGVQEASSIERRCASGIDPRIPGLKAVPIPLSNGKSVVIVHVPPSASRPHMVIHSPTNTRMFFIRHSESTVPMSAAEIRHAVLSGASLYADARRYTATQEARFLNAFSTHLPVLTIHAMPLVAIESPWTVTEDAWQNLMFGHDRYNRKVMVKTNDRRTPIVEGVSGANSRESPSMVFEIHRNGYLGASMTIETKTDETPPRTVFWEENIEFIKSFGDLCDGALTIAKSDRPYLLQLALTDAKGTIFGYGPTTTRYSRPIGRDEIRFPELMRESGQSFVDAVAPWGPVIWNAFGLEARS